MYIKSNKGITIISLAITMIVLAVIAGITITSVTKDKGTIMEAKEAKSATEIAEIKQNIVSAYVQAQSGKRKRNEDLSTRIEDYLKNRYGNDVTVTLNNNNGKYIVNVKDMAFTIDKNGEIALKSGLTLSKNTTTLRSGQQETLTVTLDTGVTGDITWSSSNSNVVSVTDSGVLTAGAVSGKAIITAKIAGTEHIDKCEVEVANNATGVTIAGPANNQLNVGANTTLTASLIPANASDTSVTWSASGNNVVQFSSATTSVSNGTSSVTVTGQTAGSTTITATSSNGATSTFNLTVNQPATINFYIDGVLSTTQESIVGGTIGSLPPEPTKDGYTFLGWYDTSESTGGNQYTANSIVNSATLNLYARWEANWIDLAEVYMQYVPATGRYAFYGLPTGVGVRIGGFDISYPPEEDGTYEAPSMAPTPYAEFSGNEFYVWAYGNASYQDRLSDVWIFDVDDADSAGTIKVYGFKGDGISNENVESYAFKVGNAMYTGYSTETWGDWIERKGYKYGFYLTDRGNGMYRVEFDGNIVYSEYGGMNVFADYRLDVDRGLGYGLHP